MKDDETFYEYMMDYLAAIEEAVAGLNYHDIFGVADTIAYTQYMKGRLFILGIGGSAGNATHAVNDFRKLCDIESYCPTDNVSELTARINDEQSGWDMFFVDWLNVSHLSEQDTVMILSVSGGNAESRVSRNLVNAVNYARDCGAAVVGIVGKKGYTYVNADACVVIPEVDPRFTTPITESLQAVVWHLIATSPGLSGGVGLE
jgi:D-sedoheptulose 7-phosphate isomerase